MSLHRQLEDILTYAGVKVNQEPFLKISLNDLLHPTENTN